MPCHTHWPSAAEPGPGLLRPVPVCGGCRGRLAVRPGFSAAGHGFVLFFAKSFGFHLCAVVFILT